MRSVAAPAAATCRRHAHRQKGAVHTGHRIPIDRPSEQRLRIANACSPRERVVGQSHFSGAATGNSEDLKWVQQRKTVRELRSA
jgi:hypothetical protein